MSFQNKTHYFVATYKKEFWRVQKDNNTGDDMERFLETSKKGILSQIQYARTLRDLDLLEGLIIYFFGNNKELLREADTKKEELSQKWIDVIVIGTRKCLRKYFE